MILRTWRGLVAAERAAEYAELVRCTGLPGYREAPGNLDAQLAIRHRTDGRVELLALSWWLDLDGIRTFTGPDPEIARRYPEDRRFLAAGDAQVRHYEVDR